MKYLLLGLTFSRVRHLEACLAPAGKTAGGWGIMADDGWRASTLQFCCVWRYTLGCIRFKLAGMTFGVRLLREKKKTGFRT